MSIPPNIRGLLLDIGVPDSDVRLVEDMASHMNDEVAKSITRMVDIAPVHLRSILVIAALLKIRGGINATLDEYVKQLAKTL